MVSVYENVNLTPHKKNPHIVCRTPAEKKNNENAFWFEIKIEEKQNHT